MALRLGVRLGQVRLGQVRLGQVRIGQVRLGQVRSLTCTADKIIDHFYMKKFDLLHFTVANKMSVNCSTLSSSCHFFCHLLKSGLARINWIRAVDTICVEQLICCQKCRANDCRAIAFRAVHPHSTRLLFCKHVFKFQFLFQSMICQGRVIACISCNYYLHLFECVIFKSQYYTNPF